MLLPTTALFLILTSMVVPIMTINTTECNGFQANFDIKSIIGTWHVVALIPEKLFPENQKQVHCFKMELSETDEAGLRWLISRKTKTPQPELLQQIKGIIVRQRYHTECPFDIWSQAVPGVKGCFRQVLSLDTNKTEIVKAITHDAVMQLHVLEDANRDDPFLLQILWGKMVSAVIYRRTTDVTQDQLKTAYNFLAKLKGPQRIPIICDKFLKEILI